VVVVAGKLEHIAENRKSRPTRPLTGLAEPTDGAQLIRAAAPASYSCAVKRRDVMVVVLVAQFIHDLDQCEASEFRAGFPSFGELRVEMAPTWPGCARGLAKISLARKRFDNDERENVCVG
jgi:hypothetical protein